MTSSAISRGLACRDLRRFCLMLLAEGWRACADRPPGISPTIARLESRRRGATRRARFCQACALRSCRVRRSPCQASRMSCGHEERLVRPSRYCLRVAGDLVVAERRAVGLLRSLQVGRALADRRAAGDQRRLARCRAPSSSAAATASRSWPSTPEHASRRPLKRAAWSIEVDSEVGAVDGDVVVVPQHDELRQFQMPGKIDRLVADAFLQAAVAGDRHRCNGRRASAPKRAAIMRSASAMPTAVAIPCPSGPVVVSMPSAWPYSGWPAVFGPSWRKLLQLIDRHVWIADADDASHIAASSRGRPKARSGRGPASRACDGSIADETVEQHGRRRRPCPSACPDGRNWPSGRHPWQARGWRSPCPVR